MTNRIILHSEIHRDKETAFSPSSALPLSSVLHLLLPSLLPCVFHSLHRSLIYLSIASFVLSSLFPVPSVLMP